MAMMISRLALSSGPAIFYSERWMKLVEDHIDYLKGHPKTKNIDLDPHKAHLFRYDFYGFLNSISVPPEYQWCYLRVNEMRYPEEFVDFKSVWLPDPDTIEELRKRTTAT